MGNELDKFSKNIIILTLRPRRTTKTKTNAKAMIHKVKQG